MVIRVAFPLFGRGGWTGGHNYLKNTLKLISSRLDDKIKAYLFLSPSEYDQFGQELSKCVEGSILVDPVFAQAGRGLGLANALFLKSDRKLQHLLTEANINVVFEHASFYGTRFPIPVVSWLPDFQHRHMPNMFTTTARLRRELGFRMQTASKRTLMVSSETAQHDLEIFYPSALGKNHVVRFAIDVEPATFIQRSAEIRETYNLPQRFFFLPNQFWKHKNHEVVIAALAKLKASSALDTLPPIILTGQSQDPRNPMHFDRLMRHAREAGVESHFRYLGLVPYDHVLSLNAACEYMLNPSLFEGWSTPVEEAKTFATPLLLSDIPIHREQSPDASFFNPHSADALATIMSNSALHGPIPRPGEVNLRARQSSRLEDYAKALHKIIIAAAST